MIRRPPRSTRTDTLFPDTTLFRSDQVEGAVLARHAVHVWRVPRILQVAFLRVRTQPAAGVARLQHQVLERTGQAAGVHLVGMNLLGHGLHHRQSKAAERLVAPAEDTTDSEHPEAAEHTLDDYDPDDAQASIPKRRHAP